MYCPTCGTRKETKARSRYCENCGAKQKSSKLVWILILAFFFIVGGTGIYAATILLTDSDSQVEQTGTVVTVNNTPQVEPTKKELNEEYKRDLTEVISDAQETVYTIFTDTSQGSGFLYNDNGAVVTNAHVVEGYTDVYVKTVNGTEYHGQVIGYSNETDVAVIQVADLKGKNPFPIEKDSSVKIGEEVIALGSPHGLENTALMGYISGQDRNFTIGSHIYENVYQITSPIGPGNSGGPLISKSSEKIIAINSAQSLENSLIGFSIPVRNVTKLIDAWIQKPMSEEAVLTQFYHDDGEYYFSSLWDQFEGFFDSGDYSDLYSDYWEYDYHDFWNDYGFDMWDYYEDDDYYYDHWYDDSFYDWYDEWYDYDPVEYDGYEDYYDDYLEEDDFDYEYYDEYDYELDDDF